MKFQEGDKIMVRATGDRGVVVEWINKKMLTIDVGGICFPVYADQIDFPYFTDFTAKPVVPPKPTKTNVDAIPTEKNVVRSVERDGLWLAFFPILDKDSFEDDIIAYFRIFLLNHTDDALDMEQSIFYGNNKELDVKTSVRALEEIYLFDLPFERLNDQPSFQFVFSLKIADVARAHQVLIPFKPKPKQFFKQAETVLREQQASFRQLLFAVYPEKGLVDVQPAAVETPTVDPDDELGLKRLAAAGFTVKTKTKK